MSPECRDETGVGGIWEDYSISITYGLYGKLVIMLFSYEKLREVFAGVLFVLFFLAGYSDLF
ncbi:putative membrane protein [Escherichia coli 2-156-04_S3_C3]|nr:putative membrane protein [Escherichia coli 2-156-04_S3_C3]